jgi:hypothetical protein
MRSSRTVANGREPLPRVDKLGVTGSSPGPPIQEALLVQRSVVEPPNAPKAAGVVVVMVTGGGPALSMAVG